MAIVGPALPIPKRPECSPVLGQHWPLRPSDTLINWPFSCRWEQHTLILIVGPYGTAAENSMPIYIDSGPLLNKVAENSMPLYWSWALIEQSLRTARPYILLVGPCWTKSLRTARPYILTVGLYWTKSLRTAWPHIIIDSEPLLNSRLERSAQIVIGDVAALFVTTGHFVKKCQIWCTDAAQIARGTSISVAGNEIAESTSREPLLTKLVQDGMPECIHHGRLKRTKVFEDGIPEWDIYIYLRAEEPDHQC